MACESDIDEEINSAETFHEYAASVSEKYDHTDQARELEELAIKAKHNRYDAESVTGSKALQLCYTGKEAEAKALLSTMASRRNALQGELASILEKIEEESQPEPEPEPYNPPPYKGGSGKSAPRTTEPEVTYGKPKKKSAILPMLGIGALLAWIASRR